MSYQQILQNFKLQSTALENKLLNIIRGASKEVTRIVRDIHAWA